MLNIDRSMQYLDFVAERHRVWERRQGLLIDDVLASDDYGWSYDPAIRAYKFTNVFRVLDRGSQFVLKELLSDGTDLHTQLFRAFLYRYTNRPDPWSAFQRRFGHYPFPEDAESGVLLEFWREYRAEKKPIFGNAYKMFSGAENKGTDRLTWAVNLAGEWVTPSFSERFLEAGTMAARHELLMTIPRCANFMAMQILTDIGWSPLIEADENEFVVAGPGARRGAAALDPSKKATWVFDWAREALAANPGSPLLRLPSGRVRPPSLMDVQNTFCEFSKYVRYIGRPRKLAYRPAHRGNQPTPLLPAHWDR